MNPMNLEIQLEACLRRLAKGATIEECLAAYPHNRSTLEPLLRTALELSAAVPAEALPTPEQIERMQAKVLTGVAAQSKIIHFPTRTIIRFGLLAAGISLILGGYVVLAGDKNDGETHGEALSSTATEAATEVVPDVATTAPTIIALAPTRTATDIPSVTASPRPSDTATTDPSDTPPPTVTDTVPPPPSQIPSQIPSETPIVVGDATELAVYVDITGPVTQDEQITVAGVPIVEENAGDFGFASGEVVTVSGLLLDEGQVLLEEARLATPDEQANMPQCPTDTPKCDPVLLVLGEALDVEYTELAALSDTQLGNGEIARIYLLAQAGAGDVTTLIAQRTAGASWRDLLPADASPFANGVNLGNGKGQSIREGDSTPIYPGNSGNAPGQTHRPTARPSNNSNNGQGNSGNNGQGNQGNNGNNGNQGNSGNNGQGNNGNNGQGNQGNDE